MRIGLILHGSLHKEDYRLHENLAAEDVTSRLPPMRLQATIPAFVPPAGRQATFAAIERREDRSSPAHRAGLLFYGRWTNLWKRLTFPSALRS